jgi:hypothetical protein
MGKHRIGAETSLPENVSCTLFECQDKPSSLRSGSLVSMDVYRRSVKT